MAARFPYIDLKQAVERAETLYRHEKHHEMTREIAAEHWEYSPKSSGGRQTIAALIAFGLLEKANAGRVKLTRDAQRIVLDKEADTPERQQALKRAALRPSLYKQIRDEFGPDLPSVHNMKSKLVLDWGVHDGSVGDVLEGYQKSMAFAGLDKDDTMSSNGTAIAVGDYVQWESQGAFQLPEPTRVVEINEDGFAFLDGSATGIPVDQLVKQARPGGAKGMDTGDRLGFADDIALELRGADGGPIDKRRRVVAHPSKELLSYRLAESSRADVTLSGPVDRKAIRKLIQFLELEVDTYPAGEDSK